MSPPRTPGRNLNVSISRNYTINGMTPYELSSIINFAKTTECVAKHPIPPGHHLVAYKFGVCMMNSSVFSSNVAVVSRLETSDPWPNSVYP